MFQTYLLRDTKQLICYVRCWQIALVRCSKEISAKWCTVKTSKKLHTSIALSPPISPPPLHLPPPRPNKTKYEKKKVMS